MDTNPEWLGLILAKDTQRLDKLLRLEPDLLAQVDDMLHEAVRQDAPSIVRLLLSHGANPNCCKTLPVVMMAATLPRTNCFLWLDEAGADVLVTHEGKTCLQVAVEHGQQNIVNILLDRGLDPLATSGKPLLQIAVEGNHVNIAMRLLHCGMDPNLTIGEPLLYTAVSRSWIPMTQLLLQHGADPLESYQGQTIAEFARRTQSYSLVQWIEEAVAARDA